METELVLDQPQGKKARRFLRAKPSVPATTATVVSEKRSSPPSPKGRAR